MSDVAVDAPVAVSLESLLAAKERRYARQQQLLARHQSTLVSLTLVTPGSVKDSPLYRRGMAEAVAAFNDLCLARGWEALEQQLHWLDTGAEAFWVITKDALSVKAAAIALEDQHPLGRLWDFDVFCPQEGSISRTLLAHDRRRCILCDESAHACARSRRHALPDVIEKIEGILHAWFNAH
ncbi:citrate lyase holo-[acyl-carrier protein] synthase [Dickeya solani]|uniref:Apo-citrate lyase phosphoribosyl-dephospho-CoA transferase n=1 Tax=Dickeya solani D s0432-1 TaxID=1231725 RepID=A0AAV3KCS2_9GAMM|nr:citrate lyase holo-[acyl-carrier protein] synthase [Dickeya solani]ANE77197.1 apo-citrate lyase phosphoribosyl-dephospho-CoA transferase [Dickeya solani IPO 2222]AUC40447.1 Apo-citrate lyase phosphoribosyl-dephospho-CoA transferase [Dickeya solani RNS 08.23.3.1.A]AUH07391.1 holo-ACP synthase CitX [Dickeya solani D s0432-1]AYQ47773.1 Apo-citrate lyase phosphoribosyl-dephospho-CoA transferase [Dickeya solani]AYQ51944.1 Apo-citrate lyase phosphoribosyl-dephospho-CoA transferase [Dickeya solani